MTKEQAMRNTKRPIPNDAPSSDATSSTTDANLAGKRNKMTKLVNKKTKIYKFAPVDNITGRKADGPGVLKSISVSQIRNSASSRFNHNEKKPISTICSSKEPTSQLSIQNDTKMLEPKEIPTLTHAEEKGADTINAKNKTNISKPSSVSPREEVVWQNKPNDRMLGDKTASTLDISDEIDRMDNFFRNPSSSTPLIPTKWKGILKFDSLENQNAIDDNDNKNNDLSPICSELKDHIKPNNDLLRDIDDILNDIKGSEQVKIKSSPLKGNMKLDTIPSSPIKIDEETPKPIEQNEQNELKSKITNINTSNSDKDVVKNSYINCNSNTFDESDDDDDLIIEMLSQKLPHPSNNQSKVREGPISKVKVIPILEEKSPNDAIVKNTTEKMAPPILQDEEIVHIPKPMISIESDLLTDDSMDDSLLEYFNEPKLDTKTSIKAEESSTQREVIVEERPCIDDVFAKRAQWSNDRQGVVRLVVKNIKDMQLPKIGQQKLLSCVNSEGRTEMVILRNPWVCLDVKEGDVIHIIEGKNFSNKRLLSDNKDPQTQLPNDNLLILHPDLLLSATTIGSSIRCLRSSLIQMLFKDSRGEPSLVMTVGNIVHDLLQSSFKYKLTHKKLTQEYLEEKLDELLEIYSFAIIICDETVENVRTEIQETHVSNIFNFVNKYVTHDNFGCYVNISGTRRTVPLSITNIIDIEENIWSPVYGFKGFLDATVITHRGNKSCLVPIEVKTGKLRSIAHEAQGLIYTLLLRDRYEIPVDSFLLYYTRDPTMTEYPFTVPSMRHILIIRNKMATLLEYRLHTIYSNTITKINLQPLNECRYCERCSDRIESLILHALLSESETLDDIAEEEYLSITSHLKGNLQLNRDFFIKYNDLITKEESSTTSSNQEMFLKDSKSREELNGFTLSNLIVSNFSEDPDLDGKYLYSFVRHDSQGSESSLKESQIYPHDFVFISDESGHFVLTQGSVVEITDNIIVISTPRQLLINKQKAFSNISDASQSVKSVLLPISNTSDVVQSQRNIKFRIDKNNIQPDMSTARFNLLNIFLPPAIEGIEVEDEKTGKVRITRRSDGGDQLMRQILVDDKKPTFVSDDTLPHVVYDENELAGKFNENQLEAIDKAVRCNDYSLILGMPGTGKTTVITELIKLLTANGKSVLLTSYTHSAVDNILLKLLDSDVNIARVGSKYKVNPRTQKFIPSYDECKSYREFINMIDGFSVVATTCLGINDLLFSMRTKDFDYVIIDEASQISLPVALGPLRYGNRFIMVGDHYQLPPLVKNDVARENGLEDSMFKILSERHPECMTELTYQYRMCGDIVKLSNFLIYEDKLKCGTDEVYNQSLEMLNPVEILPKFKRNRYSGEYWLEDVLNPTQKVLFLDHDNIKSITETSDGDNITNVGEVQIIKQCLQAMLQCGVTCEDIGIMSLYRAQLRLLKRELHEYEPKGLEILTADQFQGRDKKCIIISMVRSNDELRGGALLKELRRVNVAMTRAKSKLIIVGSKKTISSISEISGFMKMLDSNRWIYDLPSNSLDVYDFTLQDN